VKRLFTKMAVVAVAIAILSLLGLQSGDAANPFSIPP
jgi:hypothetical protein